MSRKHSCVKFVTNFLIRDLYTGVQMDLMQPHNAKFLKLEPSFFVPTLSLLARCFEE